MPRRARRGAANGTTNGAAASSSAGATTSQPSAGNTKAGAPCADGECAASAAAAARVTALLGKILAGLHDQRTLRVEAGTVRARVALLDGEYVTLHAEYERSLGARDRLDALSRELSRQNKQVLDEGERALREERRLREMFVARFSAAIDDVSASLGHQTAGYERADAMREHLARIRADFGERARVRRQLAEAARHTRAAERRLAEALVREARQRRERTAGKLASIRAHAKALREEEILLRARLGGAGQYSTATASAEEMLARQRAHVADCVKQVSVLAQAGRELAGENTARRNENAATLVRIGADEAEAARLSGAIRDAQSAARAERVKREALERLCRRVTEERASLHSEVIIMQQTWANLKGDIDGIGTQTGQPARIAEALRDIIGREFDAGGDMMGAESELDAAIRRALEDPRGMAETPAGSMVRAKEPIDHRAVPARIRQTAGGQQQSGAAASSSPSN